MAGAFAKDAMGRRSILRTFAALVAGQAAGTVLGYVFWVVTAHLFDRYEIGVASAAITTLTLIGSFTTLGLGTFLIIEIPVRGSEQHRRLVMGAVLAVTTASAVVGLVVWACVPGDENVSLPLALADGRTALLFVIGCAATAVALVLDQASLAVDRSRAQALRNALASGGRIPLVLVLILCGVDEAWVLVAAWVIPLVLSDVVLFRLLRLPAGGHRPDQSYRTLISRHWRQALSNYRLSLALAAGPLLIPVVAGIALDARPNADFTMAWLMVAFVYLVPYLLSISLLSSSASGGEAAFLQGVRTSLPTAWLLSALLIVGAWLLGPVALHVLGSSYADRSAPLLALLSLAGLWAVVKDHLVVWARVSRRLGRAAAWVAVASVLECAAAFEGARLWGARGLCIGWLIAQAAELVVCTPALIRLVRRVPWRSSSTLGPAPTHQPDGRATMPRDT